MGVPNAVFAASIAALVIIAGIGYGLYLTQAPAPASASSSTSSAPITQTSTVTSTTTVTHSPHDSSTELVTTTVLTTVSTVTITSATATTSTVTVTATSQPSRASVSYVGIVSGAGSNASSNGYVPASLVVVIGVNSTVVWVNNDWVPHTISSSSSAEPFSSGNLDAGKAYVYTFTKPGTYQYFCAYHGWMHGAITVKSSA